MRRVVALTSGLVACAAAPASAQEPACPTPRVLQILPPFGFHTGAEDALGIETVDATRVAIDWGDGTTQELATPSRGFTFPAHRFRAGGRPTIVITAVAACPAPPGGRAEERSSGPVRVAVRVRRACARREGAALFLADCDAWRGRLRLGAAGLWTRATWLTGRCLPDAPRPIVLDPEATHVDVDLSACETVDGPPRVAGRLPVSPGRRLSLRLGAPARRVTVALPGGHRLRATRRRFGGGRNWVVTVPDGVDSGRVRIVAHRGRRADAWTAAIRVL